MLLNSLGCSGGTGCFGSGQVRVGPASSRLGRGWTGLKNLRPGPAYYEACLLAGLVFVEIVLLIFFDRKSSEF